MMNIKYNSNQYNQKRTAVFTFLVAVLSNVSSKFDVNEGSTPGAHARDCFETSRLSLC